MIDGRNNYCAGHPLEGWEAHAAEVADEFHALMLDKYARGQEEHGGELWRKKRLLDKAIEEAVDLAQYLLTLRGQLDRAGFDPGEIDE